MWFLFNMFVEIRKRLGKTMFDEFITIIISCTHPNTEDITHKGI